MGNRMAARAPVFVLLLVALACLAFPAAAHGGGSVLSHKRQLLGVFDDLKSMLNKLASGFEKDIHKVEHALAEIPSDLEVELTKLETFIDKIDNQEDLKTAVKAIGDFILKFQPWLVRVNAKVFGPELAPILEKLELAAVEQVPVVGYVFKVLVEGVDIYDDIKGMRDCIKDKDYLCAGKDLLALFSTVSGIMEADFSNMKDVIKGLEKVEKVMGAGIDAAETISEDIPKLKDMFDKLHHPSVQDVISAVSDLGDVCVDIVTMAKNVDPSVVAKFKAIAARFKTEVAVAKDIRYVWIAGTDIWPTLQNAESCWKSKDYVCVGTDIAKMIQAVDSVLDEHFKACNKVATALADVGDAVNVAVDTEEMYKDFDSAFNYLKDPTASNVAEAAGQLSAALTTLSSGINTVNTALGGNVGDFAKKLTAELKVVSDDAGKAKQVLVSGIDIYGAVQAAEKCWANKDYACLAEQIKRMIKDVSAAAAEFNSMKSFCAGLAKVYSAADISEDVVATYGTLKSIFNLLASRPLTVVVVQQSLQSLSTALTQISSEVGKLNALVGHQMDNVAKLIQKDVAAVQVVDNDVQTVMQDGADVAAQLKQARTCWSQQDFKCVGAAINAIVSDVEQAVAVMPNVQKLANIVTEVGTDVKLGGAFLTTYGTFEGALKDIATGSEESVKQGLQELSTGFTQLQSDLTDLDEDTKKKYTAIIAKLSGAVTITKTWTGKVETIVIDGEDVHDDLVSAAQCADSGDWQCVATQLKKVVDVLTKGGSSINAAESDDWTDVTVTHN